MSLQLKVKLYAAPLLKPGFRTPSRACIPFLTTTNFIRTRRLSEFATLPVRGSALAAGYDLSASADCVVPGRCPYKPVGRTMPGRVPCVRARA